jgi:hypothetical protein
MSLVGVAKYDLLSDEVKLKLLEIDNDMEFVSYPFNEFFKLQGRRHRRCMCLGVVLPKTFLCEYVSKFT